MCCFFTLYRRAFHCCCFLFLFWCIRSALVLINCHYFLLPTGRSQRCRTRGSQEDRAVGLPGPLDASWLPGMSTAPIPYQICECFFFFFFWHAAYTHNRRSSATLLSCKEKARRRRGKRKRIYIHNSTVHTMSMSCGEVFYSCCRTNFRFQFSINQIESREEVLFQFVFSVIYILSFLIFRAVLMIV